MKFTQFVQQYLANNKNSGLTYREAMKDDGVRCAYKQFEADQCKKGIVRKPEKRPEPKKRYNKDTGCGDNVINQYIDNQPKWSPPSTGAPPQPPAQKPGFPPPPPTAPRGSYRPDPFQQMAQDPYWQRNPALLEQARRQYEQAQAEAQQVRETAEREEPQAQEFIMPPESIEGEIPPESLVTTPFLSTIPSYEGEDSTIYTPPTGVTENTDNFILDQTMDQDEESAATQPPPPPKPKRQYKERSTGIDLRNKPETPLEQRRYIRNTEVPRLPLPLMSEGVQPIRDRTLVRLENIPEQELYEIIDEELMNSQAAVDREKVMEQLRKERDRTRSGIIPLKQGGVKFTDEEEATKLISDIADIVVDEAVEDGGEWISSLGFLPDALKEVELERKKEKKERRDKELDKMWTTYEKYLPVLKNLLEKVQEDARQARQREAERAAERKILRQEKKKTSKERRDGGEVADDTKKKPRFGTREYRQELRQRIREGVNSHLRAPPSRGVRPISETMQYRPDVPFHYTYTPQRGVRPEDITRSVTSGVSRDRSLLGLNERNMEIDGSGISRKGKLKELISALIDVI